MEFTSEIKKATSSIYNKVSKKIPEIEWATHAPYTVSYTHLRAHESSILSDRTKNKYLLRGVLLPGAPDPVT